MDKTYRKKIQEFSLKVSVVKILVLFIILFSGTTELLPQEAKVKKMSSATNDSIEFEISVDKPFIKRGDNIKIKYVVRNKNSKNVYLVKQSPLFVRVNESLELEIVKPVGLPASHDYYNYDFIKIKPKSAFTGVLIIESKHYTDSKIYAFDVDAEIRVGFSYLFDISSQKDCQQIGGTLFCLSDLYEKSKSLTIGNLVIDINN